MHMRLSNNPELAKIAQWGVKLHFLGEGPKIEKFVTSNLTFILAPHFDNFNLFEA